MSSFATTWKNITIPGHVIGVGINGVLIYVGMRKGGWWHILTAWGAFGALAHASSIIGKIGQSDAPAKV